MCCMNTCKDNELLLHLYELKVYSSNELTFLIKQKERKSK